jgi:hypothetical protein
VATNFSYHSAYNLISILTLLFLARAAETRSIRPWYVACALLGLAVLTIEYWLLLVPAFVLVLYQCAEPRKNGWKGFLRPVLTGGGIFAACLTLAWPPFLWRLGIAKPFLLYAGLMIHPLEKSGFRHPWIYELAVNHIAMVGLFLLGSVLCWFRLPKEKFRALGPVFIYLGLFLLINFRVAHMKDLYAGHIIPFLAVIAGLAVWLLLLRYRVWAAWAIGIAAFAFMVQTLRDTGGPALPWRSVMGNLKSATRGKVVLAFSSSAVFNYYLEGAQVIPEPSDSAEFGQAAVRMKAGGVDFLLARAGTGKVKAVDALAPEANGFSKDSLTLGSNKYYAWKRE